MQKPVISPDMAGSKYSLFNLLLAIVKDIRYDHTKKSIISPTFDVNLISRYKLVVKIYRYFLTITVFDTDDHCCIAYEQFRIEGGTMDEKTAFLNNLWSAHQFLGAAFWRSVILLTAEKDVTFVPLIFAEVQDAPIYLRFNGCDLTEKKTYYHKIWGTSIACFHAIPTRLEQWIKKTYTTSELLFYHSSSVFLKEVSQLASSKKTSAHLYACIFDDNLTVVVMNEGNLRFINSFTFRSPSDLIYYLLLVAEEHQLKPEEETLHWWGDFEINAPMADVARNYFREIVFGSPPEGLKFANGLDEITKHYNFDLFAAYKMSI